MNNSIKTAEIRLRAATLDDADAVIDLDAKVSGLEKREYWEDRFHSLENKVGRHLILAVSNKNPRNNEIWADLYIDLFSLALAYFFQSTFLFSSHLPFDFAVGQWSQNMSGARRLTIDCKLVLSSILDIDLVLY